MSNNSVTVKLNQRQDYQFDIHFDEHMPVLISDEPSPLTRPESGVLNRTPK